MKASIEQPWVKFYEKDGKKIDIDFDNFNMSMNQYMERRNNNVDYPDDIAINYFDNNISYGEMFRLRDQFAASYIKAGVKPGDVVAICMANVPEAIISVYALNKIGAKVQLIHPLSAANEIKENLNKTKAKLVIALDSTYYKINEIIDETSVEKVVVSSPKNFMPSITKPLYEVNKVLEKQKIALELIKLQMKCGKLSKKKIKILKRHVEEEARVNLDYFEDNKKLKLYKAKLELAVSESEKLEKELEHLKEKKVRLVKEDAFYHEKHDSRFVTLSEFMSDEVVEIPEYEWKKDECAILLSTGGTSGKPKLAMLSNGNFNSMLEQFLISFDRFERGEKALAIMPIFHGFGLCSCLHLPLSFGVTAVMIPKFEASKLYRLYKKLKPEYLIGVPAIFDAFKKDERIGKKVGYSHVKLFVAGGDKLKESKEAAFNEHTSMYGAMTKIAKGYGLTEGVAGVTLAADDYNLPNSIGIPMYGNIIKIVKPGTDIEVEYGEEGEICLCGPTVMLGYYEDEEETNSSLKVHSDGKKYLHTADLGFMTPDGVIYYTQRLKRMIICNGYNIHSYQVESAVETLSFIDACTLVGKDHPTKGQIPVVYVVLKPGVNPTDNVKEQIMKVLSENMAAYAMPKNIEFIDELPKTLLNKLAFKELEKEQEKGKVKTLS